MFDFRSPLFWYKLIFMFELVVAESLMMYLFKRRSRFALRCACSVCVCFLVAFFFPLFDFSYNAWYTSAMFFVFLAVTIAGLCFCFREKPLSLIFCGVIAYTEQHISFLLFNFYLIAVTGNTWTSVYKNTGNILDIMGIGAGDAVGMSYLNLVAYFAIYSLVYFLIWFAIKKRIGEKKQLMLSNTFLLAWSGVTLLINIVLSAVVTYTDASKGASIYALFYLSNLLCCVFSLGMLWMMIGKSLLENEVKIIHELWRRDKQTYMMSKEKAEFLSIRCHDLTALIHSLSKQGGIGSSPELEKIENAVNICGATIKSGNEVLDVVLAEKSVLCEKYGISFSCITDGSYLSFMSPFKIYSLFENALQNAIEAARRIENSDERFIRLKVIKVANSVMIQIENSFADAENIMFEDGLPKTSKEDGKNHGYGLKILCIV